MNYQGFSPHKKQLELIDGILNSDAKFHVISIGRQVGKTILGENLCLYWAINNPNSKILWVSPVYSMVTKVHKEIVAAITESGIIKSNNYSANELELINGSQIIFRSAERYDNIRGLTCDYGWIDESAYMKNDAWKEAIRPVFAVRGKKVVFTSTPKGRNWFYELFQLGMNPDHPRYKSYTGSSYDSPFISLEEIEDAKRTLPPKVFQQEYEAKFLESGGEVFVDIEKNTFKQWPQATGKCFAGIDVARASDYTCCTIIDSEGKIVDMYRNNQTEWSVMIQDILKLLKKWNATAMIEVNSIGDIFYEQIIKEWQDTHPFLTTNKSKNEIIEGLILDMNELTVQIPHKSLWPHLHYEMEIFTYDYNPQSRTLRYSHPDGANDDTIIATALANYNRKQNRQVGTYAYIGRI
jgi:hypothetical protein